MVVTVLEKNRVTPSVTAPGDIDLIDATGVKYIFIYNHETIDIGIPADRSHKTNSATTRMHIIYVGALHCQTSCKSP